MGLGPVGVEPQQIAGEVADGLLDAGAGALPLATPELRELRMVTAGLSGFSGGKLAGIKYSLEKVLTEFKRRFGDVWLDLTAAQEEAEDEETAAAGQGPRSAEEAGAVEDPGARREEEAEIEDEAMATAEAGTEDAVLEEAAEEAAAEVEEVSEEAEEADEADEPAAEAASDDSEDDTEEKN